MHTGFSKHTRPQLGRSNSNCRRILGLCSLASLILPFLVLTAGSPPARALSSFTVTFVDVDVGRGDTIASDDGSALIATNTAYLSLILRPVPPPPTPTPIPTSPASPTPTPTRTPTPAPTPTRTPTPAPTPSTPSGGNVNCNQEGTVQICAWVSNPTPRQYSSVTVYGRLLDNGTGRGGLSMHAVWHYRTTTSYCDGVTWADGEARCTRRISRATIGYRVRINVNITYEGQTYNVSTSFTPH